MSVEDLERIAAEIRGTVVTHSHRKKSPHLGGQLSAADILSALYFDVMNIDPANPADPLRDRFILSKGHAALVLYVALYKRGIMDEETLESYCVNGGALAEHPGPGCAPGVEAATGSLGHGLSIGLGLAKGAKLRGDATQVYVLLGDGECNEGSVWEAAMLAPALGLSNLTAIVDFNKWQGTARTQETMAMDPLPDKWSSFGWETREIDGHDMPSILEALKTPVDSGKPLAIVAHTVKGKGVSFMEDDNNWHYRIPTAEEVAVAHAELGLPHSELELQ